MKKVLLFPLAFIGLLVVLVLWRLIWGWLPDPLGMVIYGIFGAFGLAVIVLTLIGKVK